MRFHSKYHQKSHHTNQTIGDPDSASDPIASHEYPFKGDFVIVNGKLYAPSAVFSEALSSLEVDSLVVNNPLPSLQVNSLSISSITGDGGGLTGVDAASLDGVYASDYEIKLNKNSPNGYVGLDVNGYISLSSIPPNINLTSLNFIPTDEYLLESDLSSTVAPLITSDNPSGYELPREFLPKTFRDRYVGFFDYNASDALSSVTLTANVWNDIENDVLGPFTLTSYGPTDVTRVWDESISSFDFTELSLGDMVDIRLDILVTTTINNQQIEVDLVLAKGTPSEYRIPFISPMVVKNSGDVGLVKYNGIYMGNNDTLSGGGNFEIRSDDASTMKVNGWYCKVTRREY